MAKAIRLEQPQTIVCRGRTGSIPVNFKECDHGLYLIRLDEPEQMKLEEAAEHLGQMQLDFLGAAISHLFKSLILVTDQEKKS